MKIRGYSKQITIKQQQEKQLKECLPNTCFFNWCLSTSKKIYTVRNQSFWDILQIIKNRISMNKDIFRHFCSNQIVWWVPTCRKCQISKSTDIEVYRILKPDQPRSIWCFNSKMSQAAYITDTSQLMQSRDWVGQRVTCSMLFTY